MAKQIDLQQMPGESLNDLYRRLAKVADQRLVRLERLSSEEGFQTATRWAYARAQKDIEKYSGSGATRFNTKPPENKMQLQAKINDIRTFLTSPSSTKTGIIEVYKKKAASTNKNYGTNFTWEDVAKMYISGIGQKINKDFGSDTVQYAIAQIQNAENPEEWVKEAWRNVHRPQDKRTSLVQDDPIQDRVVQSLLRKRSLTELLGI